MGKRKKEYVLFSHYGCYDVPIKYSEDINELRGELKKIVDTSLYEFKMSSPDKARSEDLDITYTIGKVTDFIPVG